MGNRKFITLGKGATWLIKVQNPDGGWGETCFSHNDRSLKGKGDSTLSQTAWALIGLIPGGEALCKIPIDSLEKGINYLLETQRSDGAWDESYFTGTAFPCHFYLKYHLYQQYLPLIALGRYQAMKIRIQKSEVRSQESGVRMFKKLLNYQISR